MRKIGNEDSGFSLIEVLFAAAISTVIMLGLAEIVLQGNRGARTVQVSLNTSNLQGLLQQALSIPDNCAKILNALNPPGTTYPKKTTLTSGSIGIPGGTTLATLGQFKDGFSIQSLEFDVDDLPSPPSLQSFKDPTLGTRTLASTLFHLTLKISKTPPNTSGGIAPTYGSQVTSLPTIDGLVLLDVTNNPSGGPIYSCTLANSPDGDCATEFGGSPTGSSPNPKCVLEKIAISDASTDYSTGAFWKADPKSQTYVTSGQGIYTKFGLFSGGTVEISPPSGTTTALEVSSGDIVAGKGANTVTLSGSSGNIVASGTITANSDDRLKTNVHELSDALDRLLKLRGVSYYWKDSSRSPSKQIGVIAQEIEKQFPELVLTDAKGIKSVAYQNLVAPLIEAVKQQQAEIQALRERVERMQKRGH